MNETELIFNRWAVRPVECLRNGWQLIKNDYWLFVGITLVGQMLAGVGFGLLMGPMHCGIYLCLLNCERGRRVSFDMLFKGFDYFVQGLIAVLIMMVPAILSVVVFYLVFFLGLFAIAATMGTQPQGQPQDLTMFWIIVPLYVLFIVGFMFFIFVLSAFFLFTFPLIVDRGLSGFEAVKLSARAGRANLWGILGLFLLLYLVGFVGALACYFGIIFTYPIIFATIITAYRQVFPAAGSVLFQPAPQDWPGLESSEHLARFEPTGVKGDTDNPITAAKPPEQPGIQQSESAAEQ
jgi:hypothetical protein